MEIVILVIMVLVGFSFLLKLTHRSLVGIAVTSLVMALFTAFMWRYAIEQSQTQIADWLNNPELMLDTSVILTIDVVWQLGFCLLAAQKIYGGKLSRVNRIVLELTGWVPGLLIFMVLFSLLTAAIFSLPGMEFSTIAWCMAVALLIAIPALTLLIKYLFPEKDYRIELLFMINVLIAILGVITTVNGRTTVKGVDSADYMALAGVIILFIVGAFIGYIFYKRKIKKLS
jgi:hypothetical protein